MIGNKTSEIDKEIYKNMSENERKLAETYPYGNSKFLVLVEQVMDRYRNQEIDEKKVVELIDKIENQFG